jgi:hypothetical protein
MERDRTLALDLDAFYLEHRRCGDLEADVEDLPPTYYVVRMECSCGGYLQRRGVLLNQP